MIAAADAKALVGPTEHVHVELERGGGGGVGRWGGGAWHLVSLLHLVLLQNIFPQGLFAFKFSLNVEL